MVSKLETIMSNISIVQSEIDKTKNSCSTQLERLRLGSLISRVMAYEVEFYTIYNLAIASGEDLVEEFKAFYESIKKKSSVGLVNVIGGKIEFQEELKKILESGDK